MMWFSRTLFFTFATLMRFMKVVSFISVVVFVALSVCVEAQEASYITKDIRFEGIRVTKASWLRTYMNCKEGTPFDVEEYERDLQNIRNLNLFFSVSGEWIVERDSVHIIVRVKEARYVYPYLYIGGFKESFQLALGLSNINWRGKGATLGVWYRYYDRSSLSLFYKQPRMPGSRWGHEEVLGVYGTIEPLYFQDAKGLALYDLYNLASKAYYWMDINTHIEFGGGYFHEKYAAYDRSAKEHLKEPLLRNKFLLQISLTRDSRDYSFEKVTGEMYQASSNYVYTIEEPAFPFYSFQLEWRHYRMLPKMRVNLASRLSVAMGTNRVSPYLPYVIDGFSSVRGVGNRVARGTSLALINVELRRRLAVVPWAILQGVAFGDVAWLRDAGTPLATWFTPSSNYSYAGAGIRVAMQKWYHVVLRVDYSWALHTTRGASGGWVFGVGQFF